jgi:putative ABC transport system ATP-binding protein
MPLLEIRDLLKSFTAPDGTRLAVLDVPSFALDAGEHVALRGLSGSGKTTLLNCIAGILAPDSGSVHIGGKPMTGIAESKRDALRARTIGYVFQSFNLLQGLTALENVALGMAFGGDGLNVNARATELLSRVGLGDRLSYRPRQLSIGQQQRVAVARALAAKPVLVLADEPTGNLDVHHAAESLNLIRDVCRENGAALLLVSHSPEILKAFERSEDLAAINRAARVHAATTPENPA